MLFASLYPGRGYCPGPLVEWLEFLLASEWVGGLCPLSSGVSTLKSIMAGSLLVAEWCVWVCAHTFFHPALC